MMIPRYAVYYLPEPGTCLNTLGCALLGRDAKGTDIPRLHVELPPTLRLQEITIAPRHYGLHATLKAPFELAEGYTEENLREALASLARETHALTLPPLEVGTVPTGTGGEGSFLALRPGASGPAASDPTALVALHELAARCVQELDIFRAPLRAEDAARRKNLSPRQQEYLFRWGYPYVLEEFRFHLTLTDSLEDPALCAASTAALRAVFAGVLAPHRLVMREIALVRQNDRQSPFHRVAAFAFTLPA